MISNQTFDGKGWKIHGLFMGSVMANAKSGKGVPSGATNCRGPWCKMGPIRHVHVQHKGRIVYARALKRQRRV
jgi:hypothetical protein